MGPKARIKDTCPLLEDDPRTDTCHPNPLGTRMDAYTIPHLAEDGDRDPELPPPGTATKFKKTVEETIYIPMPRQKSRSDGSSVPQALPSPICKHVGKHTTVRSHSPLPEETRGNVSCHAIALCLGSHIPSDLICAKGRASTRSIHPTQKQNQRTHPT